MVLLAGGTGGAKLARGMLDEVGADLVVIANTGDDVEAHGGYVSPDPDLVTLWLADRIDERGWGLARRHVRGDGRAARARRGRLVQPRRPRPRGLPAPGAAARRGRAADRDARRAARVRSACRRACCRRPTTRCARASAPRGEWLGFQEFMIRERRAPGRSRTSSSAARRAARADAGGAGRDRARASAVVIGPSNPVISIGPILAVRGIARRAAATPGAGRRGLAARARRGAQGPDRRCSWPGPGTR